jgi:hypothetical protein
MTTGLDDRLRAAGESALRASTGLVPRARPSRRLPVRVAVALAVVAAVVLAAIVVLGGGHRRSPVSTDGLPTVRRFIPDRLPEGTSGPTRYELPVSASYAFRTYQVGSDPAVATLYGDPSADDPFARADLLVMTTDEVPFLLSVARASQGLTVHGTQGYADTSPALGEVVQWSDSAGRAIVVASHTLDREQVVVIAGALVVDHGSARLGAVPAGLPGRLEEVAEVTHLPAPTMDLGLVWTQDVMASSSLIGTGPGRSSRRLFVATTTGDDADLTLLRWLWSAHASTEVRGHEGWRGASEGDELAQQALLWEEAPGVIVAIQSTGVSASTVARVAAGLRPATADEWDGVPHTSLGLDEPPESGR